MSDQVLKYHLIETDGADIGAGYTIHEVTHSATGDFCWYEVKPVDAEKISSEGTRVFTEISDARKYIKSQIEKSKTTA